MEYTAITFALIRKKNADLNFDNIEDITLICLDNCNLASVNNLELFSHIQELHLHHNKISLIENISYFKSLKYLDLSFNTISEEGLLQSLANIPKGLGSINLTGNPCAVDDGALSVLQDTFPDLGIIIDTVDEITGSKAENNFDEEIETKPSLVLDDIDHSRPLNADNVLKAIVDRKCKLQSISTCNIDATILVGCKKYIFPDTITAVILYNTFVGIK